MQPVPVRESEREIERERGREREEREAWTAVCAQRREGVGSYFALGDDVIESEQKSGHVRQEYV